MNSLVTRFLTDDAGAAAVEYGLLVAAIAAVIIATVFALGGWVEGAFKYTCNQFGSQQTTFTSSNGGTC